MIKIYQHRIEFGVEALEAALEDHHSDQRARSKDSWHFQAHRVLQVGCKLHIPKVPTTLAQNEVMQLPSQFLASHCTLQGHCECN